MTVAEWCVSGAVLLYLLTIAPFKALGAGQFDNSKPRDPAFYNDPIRSRALGAHLNGIETFPFFAAAPLKNCRSGGGWCGGGYPGQGA